MRASTAVETHPPLSSCLVFLLASAIPSPDSASAQLADHTIESLPDGALILQETGLLDDERSVIAWDSVVRPRTELNCDLDLAEAFRLSALPHFQSLARATGSNRMVHYVDLLQYGNRDLSEGIDQFWKSGGLRISPREPLEFLIRLYTDDLPLSPTTMATVQRVMRREESQGGALSAKTGWATLPDG